MKAGGRNWLWAGAVLAAAAWGFSGCATARPPAVEPETVGNLSASYHSVASAPIHASTDLTPAFGAVDSDDEAPVTVGVQDEKVEAPETVAKVAHGF